MKRSHGGSCRLVLHALALVGILGCTGRENRQSDSAPPTHASAIGTPAPAIATATAAPAALSCVVTDSTIGPIRLGMTFTEAKQAMPSAAFERTSDGDGAALVAVTIDTTTLMILYAEGDEDEAIQWDKRISFLETFSPACSTADGVHPQTLVLDAEKVLGKTIQIAKSEIESREFITFERQPAGMIFRIDYTGIFAEDSSETQRFEPDAKIFSIAVSSPRTPGSAGTLALPSGDSPILPTVARTANQLIDR